MAIPSTQIGYVSVSAVGITNLTIDPNTAFCVFDSNTSNPQFIVETSITNGSTWTPLANTVDFNWIPSSLSGVGGFSIGEFSVAITLLPIFTSTVITGQLIRVRVNIPSGTLPTAIYTNGTMQPTSVQSTLDNDYSATLALQNNMNIALGTLSSLVIHDQTEMISACDQNGIATIAPYFHTNKSSIQQIGVNTTTIPTKADKVNGINEITDTANTLGAPINLATGYNQGQFNVASTISQNATNNINAGQQIQINAINDALSQSFSGSAIVSPQTLVGTSQTQLPLVEITQPTTGYFTGGNINIPSGLQVGAKIKGIFGINVDNLGVALQYTVYNVTSGYRIGAIEMPTTTNWLIANILTIVSSSIGLLDGSLQAASGDILQLQAVLTSGTVNVLTTSTAEFTVQQQSIIVATTNTTTTDGVNNYPNGTALTSVLNNLEAIVDTTTGDINANAITGTSITDTGLINAPYVGTDSNGKLIGTTANAAYYYGNLTWFLGSGFSFINGAIVPFGTIPWTNQNNAPASEGSALAAPNGVWTVPFAGYYKVTFNGGIRVGGSNPAANIMIGVYAKVTGSLDSGTILLQGTYTTTVVPMTNGTSTFMELSLSWLLHLSAGSTVQLGFGSFIGGPTDIYPGTQVGPVPVSGGLYADQPIATLQYVTGSN